MSIVPFTAVDYPESDGKPMGESDLHRDAMVRHIELLKRYYEGQDVYVSGDLLVYYEQGNPKKFIVPDAFIAKGLKQQRRRIYKLWVEGVVPQLVIETTSRKTKSKDLKHKPAIYAQIGVPEYFLFDPTQDYLEPPLQGSRLKNNGEYEPIVPEADGSLLSEQLGLRFAMVGEELEFIRPDSGKRLLTSEEARQAESEARKVAELEVARLRAELEQLKGKQQ